MSAHQCLIMTHHCNTQSAMDANDSTKCPICQIFKFNDFHALYKTRQILHLNIRAVLKFHEIFIDERDHTKCQHESPFYAYLIFEQKKSVLFQAFPFENEAHASFVRYFRGRPNQQLRECFNFVEDFRRISN